MNPDAVDATLERWLDEQRAAIDAALADIARDVHGDDSVSNAVRYALDTGGKRLRPILCLAALQAVRAGPPTPAHYRAAAAIELMHTYSLVHDDLPCMDDDDLRRGRPTTHRVFGTPAAMLAGFALIPLACRTLSEAVAGDGTSITLRHRVVCELCTGAGHRGMVAGQLLDLDAERANVDIASLTRIHALKTGALFSAALRIGGLLGGGGEDAVSALGRFGERLGLAFQITDDVLDETMDAASLGKTPGKDRGAGKSTFASLLGVGGAREAAQEQAAGAVAGLREAGLESAVLEGLVRFAVDRRR